MYKVYISGTESINREVKQFVHKDITYQEKPDETTDIIIETTNYPYEGKLDAIRAIDKICSKNIPVVTSSLCVSVSEQCSISKYPERLTGIGLYNTISNAKRIEIAPSKITANSIIETVKTFLEIQGIIYSIVPDRVGLIFPRILAMIINEAALVYDEKIATREDIDIAMKLGTNYPFGPLEWADKLGVELIYNILVSLQRDFGDDRYRPHPSLKEMVNLKRKYYSE